MMEVVSQIDVLSILGLITGFAFVSLFSLLAWGGKALYAELQRIKELFTSHSAVIGDKLVATEIRLTRVEMKVDNLDLIVKTRNSDRRVRTLFPQRNTNSEVNEAEL